MKKFSVIILAILMTIGFGTAVNAALTFDIDFWTDGSNPVNNYTQTGPGELGSTIILQPSETVWVDIYFSTDANITAGSFDLTFNSANLEALQIDLGPPFWAAPIDEITPGSAKHQSIWFDPTGGSPFVTGDDNLFASVLLHCTGISVDDLVLNNDLGFTTTTPGVVIDIDPAVELGTINQVPIPGALWLLGSALVGLVGLRRRIKS